MYKWLHMKWCSILSEIRNSQNRVKIPFLNPLTTTNVNRNVK